MIDLEVRSYALQSANIQPRVAASIRRRLALTVLLTPAVFALFLVAGATDAPSLLVATGALAAAAAVAYRPLVRREVARARSFRLEISPSRARRVIAGLASLEVERPRVAKLVDWPGLGFELHGIDGRALLFVPEHLEDYAEARTALAAWATSIETGRRSTLSSRRALGAVLSLSMVGSWLGTTADDLRVGVLATVSLFAHLGVFAWLVVRDPNVRAHQKVLLMLVFAFMGAGGVASLAVRLLPWP